MRTGYETIGRTVAPERAIRGCLSKRSFDNKNEARDHAKRNEKTHPEWSEQEVYRCGICHGFHLTTIKKGKR